MIFFVYIYLIFFYKFDLIIVKNKVIRFILYIFILGMVKLCYIFDGFVVFFVLDISLIYMFFFFMFINLLVFLIILRDFFFYYVEFFIIILYFFF